MYFQSGKPVIHQVDHATVRAGAYHPPCGLHYFLQARKKVGVVVALRCAKAGAHARPDLLVHRIDLRQAQGGYKSTDQAIARQVYAFCKRTTQHGKADALGVGCEARQKLVARRFFHAPRLLPHRDLRVTRPEQRGQLLQVVVAAEKRQVIAGGFVVLPRHQVDDGRQRIVTVLVARRYIADGVHRQLIGHEGRAHIDPGDVAGQAQGIGVIVAGAQSRGKQGDGAGCGKAWRQKSGWYHVTNTQLRSASAPRWHRPGAVKQRMFAKTRSHA